MKLRAKVATKGIDSSNKSLERLQNMRLRHYQGVFERDQQLHVSQIKNLRSNHEAPSDSRAYDVASRGSFSLLLDFATASFHEIVC
jgi:hypothetical protein